MAEHRVSLYAVAVCAVSFVVFDTYCTPVFHGHLETFLQEGTALKRHKCDIMEYWRYHDLKSP